MSIEQISVEILGRQFTIGTPESERATLLKAVELLNQKIQAIQNAGLNMESEKVAIMAALNLTHDLLKTADKNKTITPLPNEAEQRKITELLELCDKTLKVG
ncbi:MAG: cell division protein ZapA [Alysiella sp.]|uniref:cell division protein ZapA n=1 Tax=Alysiella sp. TaxID=1872483 RepID=UPI0026DA73A4|nr:cell division protein ZapA [Alysiella sp.]MDO4433149.1 cell division protein ZapA [Alysiella sp.]